MAYVPMCGIIASICAMNANAARRRREEEQKKKEAEAKENKERKE